MVLWVGGGICGFWVGSGVREWSWSGSCVVGFVGVLWLVVVFWR